MGTRRWIPSSGPAASLGMENRWVSSKERSRSSPVAIAASGLATAKRFASEGAHGFITGRRDGELAAAVNEIGKNVTGVQGDVSKLGDLDRLFSQIKREKGRLNVVFAKRRHREIRIAWRDHGGGLRLHLRHQRKRPAFHSAEGAAPVVRRCFHHPQRVNRSQQRLAILECVQCDQGGRALVRAHMDRWPQTPPHSSECDKPGLYRYPGIAQITWCHLQTRASRSLYKPNAAYLYGRCIGIFENVTLMTDVLPRPDSSTCTKIPVGTTLGQMRDVVVNYAEENPNQTKNDFGRFAYNALDEPWPCKE
jgi:hypothetical protein